MKKRMRKTKKKMNSRRNQPTDKYGEPIKPEDRKNYTDDDLYGVGKGPDDGKTEAERMAIKKLKPPQYVPHNKTGPHQQTKKYDDPSDGPKKKKVVRTIPILPKITKKKKIADKVKAVKARMKKRKPIKMDKREIRIFQDEAGFKPGKRITEQSQPSTKEMSQPNRKPKKEKSY